MNSCLPSLIAAMFVAVVAIGAAPTIKADEYVRPFPIVAIPTGASKAHKAAANEIASVIGVKSVSEIKANPVCCVWIEITGWTPNPGEPGYIIVNHSGGSIVSASNEEQLHAAVERFKESIRKANAIVEVPLGLMTSYPVATRPGPGK